MNTQYVCTIHASIEIYSPEYDHYPYSAVVVPTTITYIPIPHTTICHFINRNCQHTYQKLNWFEQNKFSVAYFIKNYLPNNQLLQNKNQKCKSWVKNICYKFNRCLQAQEQYTPSCLQTPPNSFTGVVPIYEQNPQELIHIYKQDPHEIVHIYEQDPQKIVTIYERDPQKMCSFQFQPLEPVPIHPPKPIRFSKNGSLIY
tara:strand:- start:5935 stop:6534 length:600 start_codon:yes stop_codon:yes gene_type:complete